MVDKVGLCTHGPDPAPPGVDVSQSAAPLPAQAGAAAASIQCDGNGTSGKRTQVIYARASDKPDRYGTYLASIRQWAADADQIYRDSALATGGLRRIRFVHDLGCNITVLNVTLSAAGDDTFANTISELWGLGYNAANRKYMLFVDANVYCGIGTISGDDQPGAANANNSGPSYGRVDAGCWHGYIAAHEHMHNLGGVQMSAPHTSAGWHCVDERDVMCYSDSPNYPAMQYLCSAPEYEYLFDCNHDDYYHTNPPAGSYLATKWNAANNQFLLASALYTVYVPLAAGDASSLGPANGNFESGLVAWQESSTNGWPLIMQSGDLPVTPHGGSWAVWLAGGDDEISVIQQFVVVPASAPYLTYWYWIYSGDTCGHDFARVMVNAAAAETYNLCASANTNGWAYHAVDLSAYAGQTVTLGLRAETDGSAYSSLYVDDVYFQASAAAEQPAGPASAGAFASGQPRP